MIWEPELEELRRREGLARRMGGEERVARQHTSGRLTVRERIDRLFDDGSFHETGALAGRAVYGDDGELTDFVPANTVLGQGQIDGRRAAVQGDDFTVRGGAADVAIWEKAVYAERLAHDLRIPLVRLVDGTGGGGSMKTLEQMGFSYVPPLPGFDLVVENQSVVPVLAAAFGETPDKEELGGARLQARAVAVDNRASRSAPALQDAPHPRARARPRLRLRARCGIRPPHHHLPRAARRRPVGCSRRILSITAAGLRPTPPTRWRALWTRATSSTCPS
jgi:hypothetical protein